MHFKSWYARPLMRLNRAVATRLRKSQLLTRLIFGIKVVEGDRPQYWDYTTLVLRNALKRFGADGQRTLELGIGENAVLSLYLCKQYKVSAHGVDLDPDVIQLAKQAAELNGVEIDIRFSDLFSACEGDFDLIFWNPPYVPREAPQEGLVGEQSAIESDGGHDGMDLIHRFLEAAPNRLRPDGAILLGFSSFYVSLETVQRAVNQSQLQIASIVSAWPNPSQVVVLRHRDT